MPSLGGQPDACRDAVLANHPQHLHCQGVESQGCPKGSGAMELACSQFQGRFKRTRQFRTLPGEKHLPAMELARRNGD